VNSIRDTIGADAFFPTDTTMLYNFAYGTWDISEVSSVPEPASVATALLGALTLFFGKRFRQR
jgi:hypothetical protein